MKIIKSAVLVSACLLSVAQTGFAQAKNIQPRTVVTSDGEVDDFDSFIRLLLYSNELNLVGLVYSSSEFHYAGDGKGTTFTSNMPFAKQYGTRTSLRWLGTEWMQGFIDKYAAVYDNLKKHDRAYPSPQHLKSLIKVGNIDFESEMDHNTEGSDFIKSLLLDNNSTPLHLQIWGGTNTVARALKAIEDEYKKIPQWQSIYKKVSDKATLYIILDQDETYKKYVSTAWPDVKVIMNSTQFWCFAYAWPRLAPEIQSYLNGKWFAENIKFNHGPLTGSYFLWGDGQKLVNDPDHIHGDTTETRKAKRTQYDFISEGDSPSYLYLINTGLRTTEDPSYGGWGGRFVKSNAAAPRLWQDGKDASDSNSFSGKPDVSFPQARWIEAIQNDFAARADWCVKNYKEANHAPVVALGHSADLTVKPGQVVQLKGEGKDPDGNSLRYQWWQYEEAGTYKGKITIQNLDKPAASFTVPPDAASSTIHIILQITDNGIPALTRYQRLVVKITQ